MEIEEALQRSIWMRLVSAPLGVAAVYDVAPQHEDGGDASAYPNVTFGAVVMSQADTWTKEGHAAQLRIHTYSRTGSMLECKQIQGAIYRALHKQILTVTGFNNYSLLREDSFCSGAGGSKIHGVCEYRALIESA